MKLILVLVLLSQIFAFKFEKIPKEGQVIQKLLLKYCNKRISSNEIRNCKKLIENKRTIELVMKSSKKFRKQYQKPFKWGKRQKEILYNFDYDDDNDDFFLDSLNDLKRRVKVRAFIPFRWG
jgi:hypothetical protein